MTNEIESCVYPEVLSKITEINCQIFVKIFYLNYLIYATSVTFSENKNDGILPIPAIKFAHVSIFCLNIHKIGENKSYFLWRFCNYFIYHQILSNPNQIFFDFHSHDPRSKWHRSRRIHVQGFYSVFMWLSTFQVFDILKQEWFLQYFACTLTDDI